MTIRKTTIILASILIGTMFSSGIGSAFACTEPRNTPPIVFEVSPGVYQVVQEAQTFSGATNEVCATGLTFGSLVTMITDCVIVLTGDDDAVPGFENFIQNMTATNTLETIIPDGFAWQGFTNIVSEDIEPDQDVDIVFTVSAPGSTLEEVQDALNGGAVVAGMTNSDGSEFIEHFSVNSVGDPIKVDVCHKNKNTLNVSSNAIHAHLAHGDTLGPCTI